MKLHPTKKMNTIFMKSKISETCRPHVLILKFTDKLALERGENRIALSNFSIHCYWKNIKNLYNNSKLKISASTWNGKFELARGSFYISDIQDYFEYFLKKHGEIIDNPSAKIYVHKIEKRITFRIKNGYSLELLTSETMKFLGSADNKINKDKNDENVPHFEIAEVVRVHCNIVNNDYQQDSRVLYTFVLNKPFGSLLEMFPANHIF